MYCPDLSPKFLTFLDDYVKKTGKDPAVVIEEAVSQAILRHESAHQSGHQGMLMPRKSQQQLLSLLPEFDPAQGSDTAFGDFMEQLPDLAWTYQIGRLDEWWFLVVSRQPRDFPEPLELRSVETSQAYAWLFGFTKQVKLWSAPDRFLLAF